MSKKVVNQLVSFSTVKMNKTGEAIHIASKSFLLWSDGTQEVLETLACRDRGVHKLKLMPVGTAPTCKRCLRSARSVLDWASRRATVAKTADGWHEVE